MPRQTRNIQHPTNCTTRKDLEYEKSLRKKDFSAAIIETVRREGPAAVPSAPRRARDNDDDAGCEVQ